MKAKDCLQYFEQACKEYKMVKVKFKPYYRDVDPIEGVCSIVNINYAYKYIECGHLMTDDMRIVAGAVAIQFEDDIEYIKPISKLEFIRWQTEYFKFHKYVMDTVGTDVCEENLYKLKN